MQVIDNILLNLRNNNMNKKEYLKQLSIVILGILIAFWISNIGANSKERTTQKQVLLTILNELKDNNDNIKTTICSLDTIQMTYTNIRDKNTLSGVVKISYSGLQLKNIGYETSKFTGILKDVNYKLTSKIVDNYESQNSLKETEKVVVDELLVLIKNKTYKGDDIDYLLLQILNFKNHLKNFDIEQKQLIENLIAFLDLKNE